MIGVHIRPSAAANLALVLSILSLLLLFYSSVTGMGDPAPWVPEAETAARMKRSTTTWMLGLCTWPVALALAGFGFRGARKRAVAAWAIGAVPLLALVVFGLF